MPWRSVTGKAGDYTPSGPHEMNTLLCGMFDKGHLLSLIQNFSVFADKGEGPFKIVAGYHQFFGARKALYSTISASGPEGDRRIGVIWHTTRIGQKSVNGLFRWTSCAGKGT